MKTWVVIVCLVAIAGVQVLAVEPLAFPEDVSRMPGARIVSGWEAEEGQIPWQLSVRMVNPTGAVSSCGGSIIHRDWGMTAAHCTATRVTMVLRAGAVSLWRPELLFETTEYYNHPLYIDALQSVVQPNDIALLKFPRSIPFSDRVQPIRLQRDADRNRNYASIRLEASGWGRTWTNGESPDNLQWVYLFGESNLVCWFAFGGSSIIVDSTICASGYNVTSQSTCQGDSGGPLVELAEDGRYTMVGVASFVSGTGCHTDFPAGFIRPGHYHDWYLEVTGVNFNLDIEEPTTVAPTEPPSSSSESNESSEETSESSEETSESSEETSESTEEVGPEPETDETDEVASDSEESGEGTPDPDTEEEIAPEPETEEEVAPEPETEEEVAPEPETEEEVAPEPETEEEVAPEPETEEEVAPEPETEEEVAPEPETEEEVAPEPETEEEVAPEPETEEEVAPEPETEEEVAPEPETEEEVAPEPETEEEVAPEPETEEEVAPESEESGGVASEPETEEEVGLETEESGAEASPEDENETPEETRFGFPSFAKFLI